MDAGEPTARDSAPARLPSPPIFCDVCGSPTFELRCKIICRRCGYTRDCEDP